MIFWIFKTILLSIIIIYIIHVIKNYFSPNNDAIPSCLGNNKYNDIYKTYLDLEDKSSDSTNCRKFRNKNSDVIDGDEFDDACTEEVATQMKNELLDDICTEADTQMKNELMNYVKEAAGQ